MNAEATVESRTDWLSVCLYAGPSQNTDVLLPVVAGWLERLPDHRRWYFLRYLDLAGVHLRVRVCSDPDAIDRSYLDLPALEDAARATHGQPVERLVPDPAALTLGSRTGLSIGVYSPERDKYGVGAAMEDAETHFHHSSQSCLAHRVWTWSLVHRTAIAAAYLSELAAVRGEAFPTAHRAQWGGRLRMAQLSAGHLREVMDRVDAAWRPAETDPFVGELVESHLRAGEDGEVGHIRSLHLAHMDINRLGLNPAEECLAGLVASRRGLRTTSTDEGNHDG